MKKIGEIYKNIANTCLIAWYPDMSRAERDALLERGDFEEIEGYIGAKNSIDTAIDAVRGDLERYQIFLPTDFSDIVYFSDTPNSDVEKLTIRIGKNRAIDECVMANIAVHALARIHMRWIEDNKKKFFDPKRRDKRFMFLPIEMIGWEEVLKDYVFLRPVLQLLCIKPETHLMRQTYEVHQSLFEGKLSTDGRENPAIWNLRESLLCADSSITNEEINEVIEQVISRCPNLGAK